MVCGTTLVCGTRMDLVHPWFTETVFPSFLHRLGCPLTFFVNEIYIEVMCFAPGQGS